MEWIGISLSVLLFLVTSESQIEIEREWFDFIVGHVVAFLLCRVSSKSRHHDDTTRNTDGILLTQVKDKADKANKKKIFQYTMSFTKEIMMKLLSKYFQPSTLDNYNKTTYPMEYLSTSKFEICLQRATKAISTEVSHEFLMEQLGNG